MHLTAGMRVKDGELWAEECLRSLGGFVDDIVILDDGSTDRTVEICRSFDKVRHLLRWPKSFFHEGIDRNVVPASGGRQEHLPQHRILCWPRASGRPRRIGWGRELSMVSPEFELA